MQTRIARWGNSLGIRIPRDLAREFGLRPGAVVEMDRIGPNIVLRPRTETLESILAQITDENRHAETDTGGALGREVW